MNNSGYPIKTPDSLNYFGQANYNELKLVFSDNVVISDSIYLQCFRYFRDSSANYIEQVFNSFLHKNQTFTETSWIIVKVKMYSDTSYLNAWALSNAFELENTSIFDRVFLARRKKSNKISTDSACLALSALNWVEFAEPNMNIENISTYVPNDTYYGNQWYLKNTGSNCPSLSTSCTAGADIKAAAAWDIVKGCPEIKIGISDDGIDTAHSDIMCNKGYNGFYAAPGFAASWAANWPPFDRAFYLNGGNRYTSVNNYEDGIHGTNCAGIAGAKGDNSNGITGVGFGVTIEPYKVISSAQNPYVLAAGYRYGVDSGNVDVMSCSWAISVPYSIIKTEIDNAVTNGRNGLGMAIVQATGNTVDGPCNNYGILFPASYEPVIATTGSTTCDKLKTCSGDCSGETYWAALYGPGTDVAAPSHGIETTDVTGTSGHSTSDYFGFNGTSSATPQVAGTLGLIFSANPYLNLEQARYALESTCDKVGGYTYATTSGQPNGTWSEELGYGRINAENAVKAAVQQKVILNFNQNGISSTLSAANKYLFNPTLGPYFLNIKCPSNRILNSNYTVAWYCNDIPVISASNQYTLVNPKPGKYVAVIFYNCNQNRIIYTEEVEIKYGCDLTGYNQTFSTGQTINTSISIINTSPVFYHVGADIVITNSGSAEFVNCKFVFSNCSKIIIDGGELISTNCEFISCDNWPGILQKQETSNVEMTNCLIEDATVGFGKHEKGSVTLYNCEFGINYLHTIMDHVSVTSVNSINVVNNKFGIINDNNEIENACDNFFLNYAAITHRLNTYLAIYNSYNTVVLGNSFYKKDNFSTKVTANYYHRVFDLHMTGNKYFAFFDTAISLNKCEDGVISTSEILNELGIWTIDNLSFGNCGILSTQSKNIEINQNSFKHLNHGIEYYSRISGTSWIKYNTFYNAQFGITTATDEDPVTSSFPYKNVATSILVDIQTKCNEFYDCMYGWVGTGKYINQGSISLATGNKFYNTSNWNVLVIANINTKYAFPNSITIEDPYNVKIGNLTLDGSTYDNLNFGTNCFGPLGSPSNSCNGTTIYSRIINTQLNETTIVKPNPFDDALMILSNTEVDFVRIFNILGKIELEQKITNSNDIILNTSEIPTGTKLIQVTYKSGETKTMKAIKM